LILLLLLFGWLHVILAAEITRTGQEIQEKRRQVESLQLDVSSLVQSKARNSAPEIMDVRADELNYQEQEQNHVQASALPDWDGDAPAGTDSAGEASLRSAGAE
jgi:hypothetical protein